MSTLNESPWDIFSGALRMSVQMELHKIIISEMQDQQIIVLKEVDGERKFPIVIGSNEAMAIDRRITPDDDGKFALRSEEHTSELQSHSDLVCRLLLEKKK